MRAALNYPAVRFSRAQIDCIARGFAAAVEQFNIVLFACALLWDHAHIVAQRHRESIEFMARVLKSVATRRLTEEGLHPLAKYADTTGRAPTPWAEGGWERYLNLNAEIVDAIDYANENPEKHDLSRQNWELVRPFKR